MYQYLKDAVKLFANETENVLRQQLTATIEENRALREKLASRNMTYILTAIALVVLVTFVVMVAHGLCHDA